MSSLPLFTGCSRQTLHRFLPLLPLLFVLLWSTGFIGAKYGLPYASPLTFLSLRYIALVLMLGVLALALRVQWPGTLRLCLHLCVAGLLIHAIYLGGVFTAISQGLPAGVVSLLVGLQPLLTALLAGVMLGERVVGRQWLGLALGLIGSVLVLSVRLEGGFGWGGVLPALTALIGITLGTLYQKRYCPQFDWRSGAVIQFGAAALVTVPLAWWVEGWQVEWTGEFIFALSWLVLVLSIGAISLLNHLIRSGTAVNVASLFYLVPPTTVVIAWGLFGEQLTFVQLLGLGVAVTGVALARR